MTIKQQGGIFGRNPTFNTVTADSDIQSERIGLGTAPSYPVHVKGSTNQSLLLESSDTVTGLAMADTGGSIQLLQNGGELRVYTNGSASSFGSGGTETFRFLANGSTQCKVGNFVVVNGNVSFSTAGKGIDFSATSGTGTSELFNDYEEGTFTPVIADAATGGNTGTASQAYGYYTKVGRNVTIHLNMTDVDTTGLTAGNDVYIQGLPFTSLAVTGVISYSGSIWGALIDLNVFTPYLVPVIADGQAAIFLKEWGDNTGTDNLIVSELTSGSSDLNISLSYFAA